MTSFSEGGLAKKLTDLNNTQQSIQTLSLWLIHHRKHSQRIIDVWLKELKKTKPSKRLTLLYLANDVIQNSKRKGPEFHRDFKVVLPLAFKYTAKDCDAKIHQSLKRMVNIWKERNIFDLEFLAILDNAISPESEPAKTEPEPLTKKKRKDTKEFTLRDEITSDMNSAPWEPPEPEMLAQAIQQLENSAASSDADVRERIAALPQSVSDPSRVDSITTKVEADSMTNLVDEACQLLNDYNGRLQSELEDRKKLAVMIRNYIAAHKEALTIAEQRLEEQRQKLRKVSGVRKELKSHIQSLPDLSLLPDVTAGLAPLPAAGDLFSVERDIFAE